MKKLNKKGQLGGPLQTVIGLVFALFFVGVLVFAFALAGGTMLTIETDSLAVNTTSVAADTINATLLGVSAFADFSPTLWVMAAVAALLTILIGAVGVFFLVQRK